jgi:hypothetical protein
MWAGAAHVQRMPLDVPDGGHKGEKANVLSTRERSGRTVVEVTWKVDGQVNLDSHRFNYDSPRTALNAGWEIGKAYEADAFFMERMKIIYDTKENAA